MTDQINTGVDAAAVVDELTRQMALTIRENAILKVQIQALQTAGPRHDVTEQPAS